MLSFFKSTGEQPKMNSSTDDVVMTVVLREAEISSGKLNNLPMVPKVVIGFVSPALDFSTIASRLKQALPTETTLILSTTAGELCSFDKIVPSPISILKPMQGLVIILF